MTRKRFHLLLALIYMALAGVSAQSSESKGRVLLQAGFEREEKTALDLSDFALDDQVAHAGERSLRGQISAPKQVKFLMLPVSAKKGQTLSLSFMVRSDKGSTCAVFWKTAREKTPLIRLTPMPINKWTPVSCTFAFTRDVKGDIQIACPSSFNAPAGAAWIDSLVLRETTPKPGAVQIPSLAKVQPKKRPKTPRVAPPPSREWPQSVIDFPALCADSAGALWMATLERPGEGREIGVYRIEGEKRLKVCALKPKGLTGIAAPAITGLDKGCLVVFPFERNDEWDLAYAFVDLKTRKKAKLFEIDCFGNANISPSVAAVGDLAMLVWESNAPKQRAILCCQIDPHGAGLIRKLSNPKDSSSNSYNPAIVALPDHSFFAAWDSAREDNIDIYGARFEKGKWSGERRLTSDPRIERYPHVATRGSEVWLSWQAQSYQGISVNSIGEQRIAIARVDGGRLTMPMDFLKHFEKNRPFLLRPRISFDPLGRLWLTARESGGQNVGWKPVVWVFSGRTWSEKAYLSEQFGQWRPAPMVWTADGGVAALQADDVPLKRQTPGVVNSDWHSDVILARLPEDLAPKAKPLETQPLAAPPTDFSLAEAMEAVAADFPRQKMIHGGDSLTLYWGDLHAHTDISICGRWWNQPGHDLFANRRDIEKLDFTALTDHGYDFDNPRWAYNGEQTRNNHDPGRFIAFLGQEWTSSKNPPLEGGLYNRYGHRNLIYEDAHYHHYHDSFDGDISPEQIWRQLEEDKAEFVMIPHQLADWKGKGGGNPPTSWDHHDERHQPVAEIFQGRGSYEYLGCPRQAGEGAPFAGNYLQDAWAKGLVIGVIASPDHGGGKGKAAVWATDLTRESILEAIHARHTYGTSGAKMLLRFSARYQGGQAMMGDKIQRPKGAIHFKVEGGALRDISDLVIFRNNKIVFQKKINAPEFSLEWTDPAPPTEERLWYYARFQAADTELAWSSPIWFVK